MNRTYRFTWCNRSGQWAAPVHEVTASAMVDQLAKIPAKEISMFSLRRIDAGRYCANTINISDLTIDALCEAQS